ncbi:hypothetical protein [Catenovulum maritimum]|uniref:Uncharacterized protein n=1 Tax=Catenovulum maritimum TaxID=1513271 RepID=A0A0J8GP80_9ALTE|nr:hypothetical protein [Catenovulum maritimum]KMT64620.1 hypothetical protein XM47_13335 [Catenovulum maritimum]
MSNKTIQSNSSNPRRSFIKKGALGAALVTTISSKSAWGSVTSCTVSGTLSGNLSNTHDFSACQLKGYSHGSWSKPHGNGKARWDFIKQNTSPKVKPTHPIQNILGTGLNGIDDDAEILMFLKDKKIKHMGDNEKTRLNITQTNENKNTKYSELVLDNKNDAGIWRQRITAALNAFLFYTMKKVYEADNNANFSNIVASDFFYEIRSELPGANSEDHLEATILWILASNDESEIMGGSDWAY